MSNKIYNELAMEYKANKGSEKYFSKLYNSLKPELERWVSSFVNNDLADEIVNDTFMIIWNKIDVYDQNRSQFKTWVWTISKRLCFSKLSQLKKKATYSLDNLMDGVGFDIEAKNDKNLDKDSLLQIVVDEINKLDEKYKMFFIDVYKYGLDHKQISEKRNCETYTVKNRLYSGKKKIINKIKNNDDVDKIFSKRNYELEDHISMAFQRQ